MQNIRAKNSCKKYSSNNLNHSLNQFLCDHYGQEQLALAW